jgi:hypothetical protein
VYTFVQERIEASRPPPPMSGDLNIAVAECSAVDARGEPAGQVTARALADSVFRNLGPGLRSLEEVGYEIQTRSPRDTGTADAQPAEQRSLQLEALADTANADLIITANLITGDGQTSFTPELYIADRKLGGAHELAATIGSARWSFLATRTAIPPCGHGYERGCCPAPAGLPGSSSAWASTR